MSLRSTSWSLGVSISVSSTRSGLAVPGDGVAGISKASWPLVGAGALSWVVLGVDLVRLAGFDLLVALDLLEVFSLLTALVAGALGALVPLVTAAIGASGCDGV